MADDIYESRYKTMRAIALMTEDDVRKILSVVDSIDLRNLGIDQFDARVDDLTKTLAACGIDVKNPDYLRIKQTDGADFRVPNKIY